MIRTLQDYGVHQGIDVHMECTIIELLKDGDRGIGAFGYGRERGRFRVFTARAKDPEATPGRAGGSMTQSAAKESTRR